MTRPGAPVHAPEFKRRRALNWLTMGFTYAAMYTARYNFDFANPDLCKQYGWSKEQIGWIISAASLTYGISAIFNGPIADRWGGRRAMIVGAFGSAVFNLVFGAAAYMGVLGSEGSMLVFLATIWSLNSYFQSYSALALIKVNAAWFHVSERGSFSGIFGSIIQSGRALVYMVMATALIASLPWQWKFFLPAGFVTIFAILCCFVLRDTPGHAGQKDFDTEDATSGDTEPVTFRYMARKVFLNPIALTVALAELCTGVVRKGFESWFPTFMREVYQLAPSDALFKKNNLGVVIAGILGAFVAGNASDYLFKSRRMPVAFWGYVIQIVALGVVWAAPSIEWVIAGFVMNSFAVSIVHSMLSGTASMDFGGKRAAASAAGMFDGMQYIGGFFAGAPIGRMADKHGWGVWTPTLMIFSAIGALLMLRLWNVTPKRRGGGH